MLPRFHLDTAVAAGDVLELPAAVAHHALRVLRLVAGDDIVIFNGRGGEARGALLVDGRSAAVRIAECSAVERESPLSITLLQAWIAGDKLDWLTEKAVELGVTRLVLVPTARSVVQLAAERRAQRVARLTQIVVAACAQCGRNRLPEVSAAATLAAGLAGVDAATRWLLDPAASAAGPADGGAVRTVALAVGPEGGWTDAERAAAALAGWHPARLGPRILRTETAGLAALAALQALHGDLR